MPSATQKKQQTHTMIKKAGSQNPIDVADCSRATLLN